MGRHVAVPLLEVPNYTRSIFMDKKFIMTALSVPALVISSHAALGQATNCDGISITHLKRTTSAGARGSVTSDSYSSAGLWSSTSSRMSFSNYSTSSQDTEVFAHQLTGDISAQATAKAGFMLATSKLEMDFNVSSPFGVRINISAILEAYAGGGMIKRGRADIRLQGPSGLVYSKLVESRSGTSIDVASYSANLAPGNYSIDIVVFSIAASRFSGLGPAMASAELTGLDISFSEALSPGSAYVQITNQYRESNAETLSGGVMKDSSPAPCHYAPSMLSHGAGLTLAKADQTSEVRSSGFLGEFELRAISDDPNRYAMAKDIAVVEFDVLAHRQAEINIDIYYQALMPGNSTTSGMLEVVIYDTTTGEEKIRFMEQYSDFNHRLFDSVMIDLFPGSYELGIKIRLDALHNSGTDSADCYLKGNVDVLFHP